MAVKIFLKKELEKRRMLPAPEKEFESIKEFENQIKIYNEQKYKGQHFQYLRGRLKSLKKVLILIGEEKAKLKVSYGVGRICDDTYFFATAQLDQLEKRIKGEFT